MFLVVCFSGVLLSNGRRECNSAHSANMNNIEYLPKKNPAWSDAILVTCPLVHGGTFSMSTS